LTPSRKPTKTVCCPRRITAEKLRALGVAVPPTLQERRQSLDEAYKNGLRSREEYEAKVNALNADAVSGRSSGDQQFIQNMNAEGDARHARFMAQMDRQDRHTRDVTDWILDQQLYQNPRRGQTFTGSNQYKYTYQDQSGNVLQSNTITDPSILYHADWTSRIPIHH